MSAKIIRLPYERVFAKATPASFGRALELMHSCISKEVEDLERKIKDEQAEIRALKWEKFQQEVFDVQNDIQSDK